MKQELLQQFTNETGIHKPVDTDLDYYQSKYITWLEDKVVKNNAVLPDVSKPKGTFCPSRDRCACYMESECFAETSLKYGCFRAK